MIDLSGLYRPIDLAGTLLGTSTGHVLHESCSVHAHLCFKPLTEPVPGFLEVIVALEPHPEGFRRSKIARQSKGRVGAYGPLAMYNFINTTGRYTDLAGDSILAQSHRHQEFLQEHLAGVNIFQFVHFGHLHQW